MAKTNKSGQPISQSEIQASNSKLVVTDDEEENRPNRERTDLDDVEEKEGEEEEQQQLLAKRPPRGSRASKRNRAVFGAETEEGGRWKSTRTSDMWTKFDHVTVEIGEPPIKKDKAKCKTCVMMIAADKSKNGTTAMWKHYEKCQQKKNKAKQKQTVLNFQKKAQMEQGRGC